MNTLENKTESELLQQIRTLEDEHRDYRFQLKKLKEELEQKMDEKKYHYLQTELLSEHYKDNPEMRGFIHDVQDLLLSVQNRQGEMLETIEDSERKSYQDVDRKTEDIYQQINRLRWEEDNE